MTSSNSRASSRAKCCSRCEPVGWLSGIANVLSSPDGSGNPFCFLLPEILEGNKKQKDCSAQRDYYSL